MITIVIEAKDLDKNSTLVEIIDGIESALGEVGLKSVSISADDEQLHISRRYN